MSSSTRHVQGGSRPFAVNPSTAKNGKHYRAIESSQLKEGLTKCNSASAGRNGDSKLSNASPGDPVSRVAWTGTGIWSEQSEADFVFLANLFICLAVQYYFLHRAAVHDMNFSAIFILCLALLQPPALPWEVNEPSSRIGEGTYRAYKLSPHHSVSMVSVVLSLLVLLVIQLSGALPWRSQASLYAPLLCFHILIHIIRQRWRRLGPLSPPHFAPNTIALTSPAVKKPSTPGVHSQECGKLLSGVSHAKGGILGAGDLGWGAGAGPASAEVRRGGEKVRERLGLLVGGWWVRALYSGFVVGMGPVITLEHSHFFYDTISCAALTICAMWMTSLLLLLHLLSLRGATLACMALQLGGWQRVGGGDRNVPIWSAKMWYCEGAVVRQGGGVYVAVGGVTMAQPGDGASRALHALVVYPLTAHNWMIAVQASLCVGLLLMVTCSVWWKGYCALALINQYLLFMCVLSRRQCRSSGGDL